MSPEMLKIYLGLGFGNLEPEKNDIFSLALTYLRLTLNLNENEI
jgi:hypothetical protein